jgi:hypothetical protein
MQALLFVIVDYKDQHHIRPAVSTYPYWCVRDICNADKGFQALQVDNLVRAAQIF